MYRQALREGQVCLGAVIAVAKSPMISAKLSLRSANMPCAVGWHMAFTYVGAVMNNRSPFKFIPLALGLLSYGHRAYKVTYTLYLLLLWRLLFVIYLHFLRIEVAVYRICDIIFGQREYKVPSVYSL